MQTIKLFGIGDRNYVLAIDKGTESFRAVIVPKILAYRATVASCMLNDWLELDNPTVPTVLFS